MEQEDFAIWKQARWAAPAAIALSGAAYADEACVKACAAEEAAPDSTCAARGMLGFAKTSGNTDTTVTNFLFHIAHTVDAWKFLFGTEGFYGSTKGETTAQAWGAHFRANYNFTERIYGYGGPRYDNNKFSGFKCQELVTTGVGYQFIKTEDTKLAGQIGVGARRLDPVLLKEDAVGGR